MSIYLMSSGNLFLIKQEKTKDQEILLLRRMYEDTRNYRMHGKLPKRPAELGQTPTIIDSQKGKINKVSIHNGDEVIEIEKKK